MQTYSDQFKTSVKWVFTSVALLVACYITIKLEWVNVHDYTAFVLFIIPVALTTFIVSFLFCIYFAFRVDNIKHK